MKFRPYSNNLRKKINSLKNVDQNLQAFIEELDEICEAINRNQKMLEILKTSNARSALTVDKNTEEENTRAFLKKVENNIEELEKRLSEKKQDFSEQKRPENQTTFKDINILYNYGSDYWFSRHYALTLPDWQKRQRIGPMLKALAHTQSVMTQMNTLNEKHKNHPHGTERKIDCFLKQLKGHEKDLLDTFNALKTQRNDTEHPVDELHQGSYSEVLPVVRFTDFFTRDPIRKKPEISNTEGLKKYYKLNPEDIDLNTFESISYEKHF